MSRLRARAGVLRGVYFEASIPMKNTLLRCAFVAAVAVGLSLPAASGVRPAS